MKEMDTGFKRELGLFDSTMLVIGSMIGSGIFIVSSDIARTVGSGGLLLLVWLITGLFTVIGALSYGELAAMMPRAGGQYIFLKEAYNPLIGFLYGWTLFMVIQTGTIAAVAVAFSKFTAVLIPWFSSDNILFTLYKLKISTGQLLAIFSILVLTYLNIKGLKIGKIVQDIFTSTKVIALGGLILLGFLIGSNSEIIAANFTNLWSGEWIHVSNGTIERIERLSGFSAVAAIGVAMVGSLFSSDAWNNITFTAGEVKEAKVIIPRSLFLGTLTVTIIYLVANAAYLSVLPLKGNTGSADPYSAGIQFASEDRIGTAAAYTIFGAPAEIIMALLIMISTFGCNNGLILAGARVYYAMAVDKLFFKTAGSLNAKSVPSKALMFQALWSSVLCLSGTYGQLLDYVIFSVLIFYILTIFSVIILRRNKPDAERLYKAFGYPCLQILYIILALGISLILLIYKPQYTWPGLIIVLLGIPVFYIWKRNSKQQGRNSI